MIEPITAESDAKKQRCRDAAQAFVEIGAVLILHAVQDGLRQGGARGLRDAVEIADHRAGRDAMGKRAIRSAIGRDDQRRVGKRLIEYPIRKARPADERDWIAFVNYHFLLPLSLP